MTESTETETTEETTEESVDDGQSWDRMGSLVEEKIRKVLGEWQPPAVNVSQQSSETTNSQDSTSQEKRTTPKRKQGFLSNFFQGLDLD